MPLPLRSDVSVNTCQHQNSLVWQAQLQHCFFLKVGLRCPGLLQEPHHSFLVFHVSNDHDAHLPQPLPSSAPLKVSAHQKACNTVQNLGALLSFKPRQVQVQQKVILICSSSEDSDVLGCCWSFIMPCPELQTTRKDVDRTGRRADSACLP